MRQGAFVLAVAVMVAGTAAAQFRGGRGFGGRTYGSPSGFGNILFPGTGTAPPIRHNMGIPRSTFAQRLGATITGGDYGGLGFGAKGHHQPLVYPVYYGGYGYDYGYGPMGQQPVTVVSQPPQQQPTVIINQYYTPDTAKPEIRDYTNAPRQDGNSYGVREYHAPAPSNPEPRNEQTSLVADQKPNIYLIAYRDGSIRGTLAYWIEGDTLHYITTQGSHNKASLDLIDASFSEQLNRERNIEFSLAAPR
jgi:hypothetical protein